jgi:hypothetical protein
MAYEPNRLERKRRAIMTTENTYDHDVPARAQRIRPSGRARLAAAPTGGALASTAADRGRWLTAILRPAGTLDQAALRGLSESLGHLAGSSNMVIIDLTAAVVGSPRTFARDLRAPARTFERAGQCLLLLGASPALTAELDRLAVPVITLAADALPLQAA